MAERVTIRDVAKRVGVSKTTVSHALSGKRPISAEVRNRILAAADQLGYKPSSAARAVNGQRMMMVATLLDGEFSKASAGVLLEAFQRSFDQHGYNMAVFSCAGGLEKTLGLMRHLSGGVVDGILNLIPEVTVSQAASNCAPLPVLTYLRPHIDSPVYLDIAAGMREAMEHLWTLGHRKIGFIGGERIKAADMRDDPQVEGVRHFLESKNAWDPALVRMSPGNFSDGLAYAGALRNVGATAIVAANDQVACGVLSWASSEGLKIPEDMSVVGFNDSPLAVMVTPALTAIQFPFQETADITAGALVDLIEGRRILHHKVLAPRLIIRNSTSRIDQPPR